MQVLQWGIGGVENFFEDGLEVVTVFICTLQEYADNDYIFLQHMLEEAYGGGDVELQ